MSTGYRNLYLNYDSIYVLFIILYLNSNIYLLRVMNK